MRTIVFFKHTQTLSAQWIFKLTLRGRRTTTTIISSISGKKRKKNWLNLETSVQEGIHNCETGVFLSIPKLETYCILKENPMNPSSSPVSYGLALSASTSPHHSPSNDGMPNLTLQISPGSQGTKILYISVFNSVVSNPPGISVVTIPNQKELLWFLVWQNKSFTKTGADPMHD